MDIGPEGLTRCRRFNQRAHTTKTNASFWLSQRGHSTASITSLQVQEFVTLRDKAWIQSLRNLCAHKPRVLSFVVVLAASLAITARGGKKVEVFGWWLVVARACGVGSLLWTAMLFITMARTLVKTMNRWLPLPSSVIDENAKLHIFCGLMVLLNGLLHTLAHLVSTYEAVGHGDVSEINRVLNCVPPATAGHLRPPFLNWLPCPLDKNYPTMQAVFTAEGLSGMALLATVVLMGFTGSQKRRKENYELFWYVHNFGMVAWLLLLFVHGTQGWFGIVVPYVVPFCALPVAVYSVDRVSRCLRYYLGRDVGILSVVIRPGKDGGARGALTALKVSKPAALWNWQEEGMYAYVCLPEYSRWQWHPFTICSSRHEETVDFIISGVGDWTQELAQRCLDFKSGHRSDLPTIALDGPYAAPATQALGREILIAVGAGVGITPFLALMAHIVCVLGEEQDDARGGPAQPPLQEAHFFWMARSADEFLFGRSHFTKIFTKPRLRDRVFIHLHLTSHEPHGNAPAYLFREAVRRQSHFDRAAFMDVARGLSSQELISGAQLPWCWVDGARSDVLWVSSLVEPDDDAEESTMELAYTGHDWAQGVGLAHGRQRQGTGLLNKRGVSLSSLSSGACARSYETSGSLASSAQTARMAGLSAMLPVTFGRPDFAMEIQAIGKARPHHDVHVHACGSAELVEALRNICELCTDRAATTVAEVGSNRQPQRYFLRQETFGQV